MSHTANDVFPSELIRDALNLVEESIRQQVNDFDPALESYMAYICNTAGKRIRPTLSILVGKAAGAPEADVIKLGVILELIHMATLVHDDIIDEASTRRMVPTANAKWGNGLAVLLGDALFSHALTLATDFNRLDISRKVGLASRDVCQGEIIQTQRRFDLSLTKDEYFRIIAMKTGALFAAATGLAGLLAGLPADDESRLAGYGMKLGTAYQIYDDCLDLVGNEDTVGKTLGTDLTKGKLTLPLLILLESIPAETKQALSQKIANEEPLDLHDLVDMAEYQSAISSSIDTALDLLNQCREDLSPLPDSEYKQALVQITHFLESLLNHCHTTA